jgi:hypothetical protein
VGVVFSEYSVTDEKAWSFLRPILKVNGGWAIFNFTPRGKNHAYDLFLLAQQNPETWFSEILTVDDTGILTKEDIDAERREGMPQDLIDQEYFCKFIENASQVFRNVRNCAYDLNTYLPPEGDFKLGVDLAKYQDYTVITPFNRNTFIVYPQDRFNQVDWLTQEGRIEAIYRRFNAQRLTIDSTGIGDPIVEDLKRKGLNITDEDTFKFTETSRENLLRHLAVLLEQGKIKIPNDEGLIAELESFQWEMSDRGKVKMKAPSGLHDDRVMSLALAVWGCYEPYKRDLTLEWEMYENHNKTFR